MIIVKIEAPETIYVDKFCFFRSEAYAFIKPDIGEKGEKKNAKVTENITKTLKIGEIVKCLTWNSSRGEKHLIGNVENFVT